MCAHIYQPCTCMHVQTSTYSTHTCREHTQFQPHLSSTYKIIVMFRPLVLILTLALATATSTGTKKHMKSSGGHPKHGKHNGQFLSLPLYNNEKTASDPWKYIHTTAVKSTSNRKQVKAFSVCTEPGGQPLEEGAELNYWGNVFDCDTVRNTML